MILTKLIINKVLDLRNINIIVHGTNIKLFNTLINKQLYNKTDNYLSYQGCYYIDVQLLNKSELIEFLKRICITCNYYHTDTVKKKLIILTNFQLLNAMYQQSIKTIIDISYLTSTFIVHTTRLNFINRNILSRFVVFSLPNIPTNDATLQITYNKIIKFLKKGTLNSKVMEGIRELSYMYYMNHTHSTDLQKLLIKRIGSNSYIPNSIKYKVVEDICRINVLYQHSYRKPIFFEFIIISLFKHLEHYTYNL